MQAVLMKVVLFCRYLIAHATDHAPELLLALLERKLKGKGTSGSVLEVSNASEGSLVPPLSTI